MEHPGQFWIGTYPFRWSVFGWRQHTAARIKPQGLAAFALRTAGKSSIYAYEQSKEAELTSQEVRQFKANKAAWQYLLAVAPSYRKVMVHWVIRAKQESTRARRLVTFIEACSEGRKILR